MSTITRTVCIRSHRQTRFKLSSSSSKSCSQSSFITHPCWAITTPRHASTFVPGVTPIDQIPPLPKPHSTNWFTTHPALSDSFSKFDSLIHRSRQNLYRLGILKRYASPADFTGTGVRSKWLKWKMEQDRELDSSKFTPEDHQLFNVLWSQQIKWHPLPTMAILLQSNEFRPLKMIEYNHAIKRLNELKGLKKYLMIAKSLQLTNEPEINELDSEIEEILLKYTKPEDKAQIIKTQEIERDHLGRFYGLGRKKESTARVWMIEVKIPESAIETQPPTLINSSVDSSADSSAKESDDQPESIQSQPTTEPSDEQLITSSHDLPLGKIIINGRSIVDYFHTPRQRATAIRPLEITNCMGHYNIHILTHGGGKMGQAAAISHAISQALMKALTEAGRTDGTAQERYAKKVLVKSRLSLRDPRVVERKKTGKPGAKSSYRWVKR